MARTSSPTRRSTSARVRTVVVLPVPPLSDRTAIVSAIEAEQVTVRSRALGLLARDDRSRDRRPDRGGVHEEQRVAADRDLVAVGQRAPLHAPAVHVDPV